MALFNAIAKHQKSVADAATAATASAAGKKPAAAAKDVLPNSQSFLELLKQSTKGVGAGEGLPTSATAGAAQASGASAVSAANMATSGPVLIGKAAVVKAQPTWSVLQDDYLRRHAQRAATADGDDEEDIRNARSGARKTAWSAADAAALLESDDDDE